MIRRLACFAVASVTIAWFGLISHGVESARAACCYFAAKDKDINQPGQKAFISWNPEKNTEAFTVQPKFEGNAIDFGMVIPTPSRPKLDEMSRDFFANLAMFTILMPLPQPIYVGAVPILSPRRMNMLAGAAMPQGEAMRDRRSVTVLESGVVGSLDYKIVVAERSDDLFSWLKENKYSYGGDEDTLQFYIKKKWFFTVMKIDSKQMKKGADGSYIGEVTPTRFTFASKECIYPLKITQLSVKDKTDALFYVQSPAQMDLAGDWSWMHSYRPMYLTYMLGCSANEADRSELLQRASWLRDQRRQNPAYETTKLEWAKRLDSAQISVLEDPLTNYAQAGKGDLPEGAEAVSLQAFLQYAKRELAKTNNKSDWQQQELARLEDKYQPSKGLIVKNPPGQRGRYSSTEYSWYPAREVPRDEVAKLSLLKGLLQKDQWLTKFRKVVRKEEMTDDLILATVPKAQEQTYTRIMPTSPP